MIIVCFSSFFVGSFEDQTTVNVAINQRPLLCLLVIRYEVFFSMSHTIAFLWGAAASVSSTFVTVQNKNDLFAAFDSMAWSLE